MKLAAAASTRWRVIRSVMGSDSPAAVHFIGFRVPMPQKKIGSRSGFQALRKAISQRGGQLAIGVGRGVVELQGARQSERQGRLIDSDEDASMERKKREGYF